MPSFEHCALNLKLLAKLPLAEMKEHAAEYVARGMESEAALQRVVSERLDMARMEEKSIVATVRKAYEAKGGKPRPAPEPTPEAKEVDAVDQEGIRASIGKTFYSALARALPDMAKIADKAGTIKPGQALAWLAARQKEGRFKSEELEWSGVKDWLALQDGKVAVADIAQFVKDNGVRVEEVRKGGPIVKMLEPLSEKDISVEDGGGKYWLLKADGGSQLALKSKYPTEDKARAFGLNYWNSNRAENNRMAMTLPPNTKYGQHVLPGGANYRELLLTLPGKKEQWVVEPNGSKWEVKVADGGRSIGYFATEKIAKEEAAFRNSTAEAPAMFKSSHWDEPNILAHIRFNERTDADGKRVLFVEELQSDWGQKGKKEGFDNGVARAPFVTKTDAWLQLGIKRMIAYAVENGYDKVAFVNGDQSADRYDLSKQIDSIRWAEQDGKFSIGAMKDGQTQIGKDGLSIGEVGDLVGKEIAKKIEEEAKTNTHGELSGVDLKVGGEGMKTFYDKIVPQNINDVLKKLGGGKTQEVEVSSERQVSRSREQAARDGGKFGKWNEKTMLKQVGFEITDTMRDLAKGGLPLFSKAGGVAGALDATVSGMIKEGTSVDKLLAVIEKQSASPEYRELAAALRKQGLKTGILYQRAKDGQRFTVDAANADNAKGGYRVSDDTAILYREEGAERTALHELVHAATINAIQRGGDAARQIRELWEHAKSLENFAGEYGISNEEEFVSEAYTNPRFQQIMADTPVPGTKVSMWQKLVGVVRILLGKPAISDNMLERFMKAGPELMAENREGQADGGERANPGRSRADRTIEVDGVRRPIANSRGQLVGQDFAEQTAFWKFFGDSSVVDEHGRPLVVYHGTDGDFDTFRTKASEMGAHFGTQEQANFVADKKASGANVAPVYLNIKHPLRLNDTGHFDTDSVAKQLESLGIITADQAKEISKAVYDDGKPERILVPKLQAAIRKAGYDGIVYENTQEGGGDSWIAFKPEQVKSATGNAGTFDPNNADIRASIRDAEEPEPISEDNKRALSKIIGMPKELLKSAAHELKMVVVPMSAGSDMAMAMAKDFANHNRRAAAQWTAFDKVLRNSYDDEQLAKMWTAADQENDLRREGRTSDKLGLASLTAGERRTVEVLHAYGEQLWARAKAAGMVEGDGVHYWTPRVAARIVADGSAESIKGPAGEFSKDAKNLKTTASSLKKRLHETTEESEAALKAKLGEDAAYVKNIRVMPMAMARLEQAISGRTLVNQIRAHGKLAGEELVSDESGPNFVTFDHPALKQWRPKMDWQAVEPERFAARGYEVKGDGVYREGEKLASYRVKDGEVQKLGPMMDSDGKPVMESHPLYVRKDFAGPLKAVFTTDQGAVYRGMMQLKGGVTSMIMISPLTHNLVIWGKAMPTMMSTMGWKNNLKNMASLGMHGYFIGNRARADHALMDELIDAGLVPVGGRGMNQDAGAIENGIEPGRSLTAKALGAVTDLASEKAGAAVRKGVDAAGQFWHETLLWDRVADLQAGMAVMMRASLMDKGIDQYSANRIATHFANRYGGMIPREAMSEAANRLLNLSLFSKSFTMTNLGAYKDLLGGLPKDVQAQIKMRTFEIQRALGNKEDVALDAANAALGEVQKIARKKAAAVLVLDIAAMTTVASLAQALWQGQNGQQIVDDFKERLAKLGANIKEDPLHMMAHPLDALSSLSQTSDNPHGREDRVRVGEDEKGNSYYARLPVGKVGEEMKQYSNLETGLHLLHNKMSTFLRPIADLTANEDFTGKRIIDPHDNIVKQVAAVAAYWVKSQLPAEDMIAAAHVVKGDADHMDKLKLLGTATGLSVGRLSGGDAVAEIRYESREQQAKLRDVLPTVREALRRNDQVKAETLLEQAGQSSGDIQRIINQIDNPDHISKGQLRKFNKGATDDSKDRMDKLRGRSGG